MKKFLSFLLVALLATSPVYGAGATKLRIKGPGNGSPVTPPPTGELIAGPTLAPSNGQSVRELTIVPPARGVPGSYGYDYSGVAAWNMPQFTENPTRVSFMAFKAPSATEFLSGVKNNIDYAEVECDDGTPVRIEDMTFNTETGVKDFWLPIAADVNKWPDGNHECRATIYYTTGIPSVLQGSRTTGVSAFTALYFTTNFGGTLKNTTRYVNATTGVNSGGTSTDPNVGCGITEIAPCLTISYARDRINSIQGGTVGGGTICLAAGTHVLGNVSENFTRRGGNRYLKISSCAVDRSLVYIADQSGSGGIRTDKLWIHKVMYNGEGFISGATGTGVQNAVCLITDVIAVGPNRFKTGTGLTGDGSWTGGCAVMNSDISEYLDAVPGFYYVRNNYIHGVAQDGISKSRVVVKTLLRDFDAGVYSTGSYTSGSNLVTNVSNFTWMKIGGTLEICGDYRKITAIDIPNATLTLNGTCTSSKVLATLDSGAHSDTWQISSTASNVIMYEMDAQVPGQGFFTESAPINKYSLTNVAIVDSNFDSKPPGKQSFAATNKAMSTVNLTFIDTDFNGSMTWAGADEHTTFIGGTCTSKLGPKPGITYYGSGCE